MFHLIRQLDSVITMVLCSQLTLSSVTQNVYNDMVCKYHWYHADFQSMSNYLLHIDWLAVLYENPSAIDGWNILMSVLRQTISMYVPSSELVSIGKQSHRLPRMIRKYESKRRQTWKQFMKSRDNSLLRSKCRNCTRVWRNLVRDYEVAKEKHIIDANNLGAFYRYVNKHITNHSNVGVIVDEPTSPLLTNSRRLTFLIVTLRQ